MVGYNLTFHMLQVKFKTAPGNFRHQCTISWFRRNGVWCVIGHAGRVDHIRETIGYALYK